MVRKWLLNRISDHVATVVPCGPAVAIVADDPGRTIGRVVMRDGVSTRFKRRHSRHDRHVCPVHFIRSVYAV